MAKATTTIRQVLNYQGEYSAWFATNQSLFNRVAAFYFEVIQAHEKILDLSNKEALTALKKLTYTTKSNPHPAMPLSDIVEDIPAMFRRAAINTALGSARSFYSNLGKWRKRKEKATAKGKKFTERPPVPPRTWNKSATLYAGMWKERAGSSIMIKVWTGSVWSWVKIRNTDEQVAHLVSARIVQFAKEHEATILVFEHLGNLKPAKGKYSKRGNSKRAFWMKGSIFKSAKYKAYNAGILTSRVSPRNISRECARCHRLVARYAEGDN